MYDIYEWYLHLPSSNLIHSCSSGHYAHTVYTYITFISSPWHVAFRSTPPPRHRAPPPQSIYNIMLLFLPRYLPRPVYDMRPSHLAWHIPRYKTILHHIVLGLVVVDRYPSRRRRRCRCRCRRILRHCLHSMSIHNLSASAPRGSRPRKMLWPHRFQIQNTESWTQIGRTLQNFFFFFWIFEIVNFGDERCS